MSTDSKCQLLLAAKDLFAANLDTIKSSWIKSCSHCLRHLYLPEIRCRTGGTGLGVQQPTRPASLSTTCHVNGYCMCKKTRKVYAVSFKLKAIKYIRDGLLQRFAAHSRLDTVVYNLFLHYFLKYGAFVAGTVCGISPLSPLQFCISHSHL